METSAVLTPQAGWYSSHWSIAPASVLTRPFTISSSLRADQALAGLQDLYRRAAFLLGVTSGLPTEKPAKAAAGAADPEKGAEARGTVGEAADRFHSPLSRLWRAGGKTQPHSPATAAPVSPPETPAPETAAVASHSQRELEPAPAPKTLTAVADKAEVLVAAVNRLGEALKAHEFLTAEMREHGGELITRFAEDLAPFGLHRTEGSLGLDREKLDQAYQENPQRVAEAFWGPNSLTPDITSLAAAIVGAPGSYLLDPGLHAPETYQPFQGLTPWFRVAPTGFHQVA
jgi:hypothetical protein